MISSYPAPRVIPLHARIEIDREESEENIEGWNRSAARFVNAINSNMPLNYTPFLRNVAQFQTQLKDTISNIENRNAAYLRSSLLRRVEDNCILRVRNNELFDKLKHFEQMISETLLLLNDRNIRAEVPDLRTLLKRTRSIVKLCKSSVGSLSNLETGPFEFSGRWLGALAGSTVATILTPFLMGYLARVGVLPATAAEAGDGAGVVLAAPVLNAILSVVFCVITITAGVKLFLDCREHFQDRSDTVSLALISLDSVLRRMLSMLPKPVASLS